MLMEGRKAGRKEGRAQRESQSGGNGSIEDSTYSLPSSSRETNEDYFFRCFFLRPRVRFFPIATRHDAILACSASFPPTFPENYARPLVHSGPMARRWGRQTIPGSEIDRCVSCTVNFRARSSVSNFNKIPRRETRARVRDYYYAGASRSSPLF